MGHRWQQNTASFSVSNTIDEALDRSEKELQRLANFYHQQGFLDQAQKIYRTILSIRKRRSDGTSEQD
jgi:hypothetical protein